jgi:hypothetical protein
MAPTVLLMWSLNLKILYYTDGKHTDTSSVIYATFFCLPFVVVLFVFVFLVLWLELRANTVPL